MFYFDSNKESECSLQTELKSTPRAVPQKGVPYQFSSGWENLRNTSIEKFKYDLQTLKHYFIQLENYIYTSVK